MTAFDKAGTFLDCGQAVDYRRCLSLPNGFTIISHELARFGRAICSLPVLITWTRGVLGDGALSERARNIIQDVSTLVS